MSKRITIAGRRIQVKNRGDGRWYHIASFGRLVIRRDPDGWLVAQLYPRDSGGSVSPRRN